MTKQIDKEKLLALLRANLSSVEAEYKKSLGFALSAPLRAKREYRKLIKAVQAGMCDVKAN